MSEETSNPELDAIVEQHDDFENIDGNKTAEQLGTTLGRFKEMVENDPRFECGVSPRFPWVNMESYRRWSNHEENERGENQ
jgi:hypothetical protein